MSKRPVNGEGVQPISQMRPSTIATSTGLVDNPALLCGESMINTNTPNDHRIKVDDVNTLDSDNNNLPAVDKIVNSGQLNDDEKHMNSGGHGRMTGPGTTTNKDNWLTQVTQQQSRSLISGEHEVQQTMLPLSASQTGVFRPPLTVGERPHILYSGQFPQTVYTTVGSLQRYSPTLYTSQGSLTSLHPSYYYPSSYAAGYQGRPLLPHDYTSYSAVLASMGSHVQSQLPRSPFNVPSALPHQYPHHAVTVSSARSASQSGQHPILADPHRQSLRSHSLSRDTKDLESRPPIQTQIRPVSPHITRDRKHLSPPVHEQRQDHHRSPDVREQRLVRETGGLKQRMLGLTTDKLTEMTEMSETSQRRLDERSPKRLRCDIGQPPPLQPTRAGSTSSTVVSSQSSHLPPPPPLQPTYPSQPHFPPHFNKGSIIQLANGELKRVEDLRTEDFVTSADQSTDLKIDSSTVVRIEQQLEKGTAILGFSVGEHRVQVTVEATVEHPFYVFGRGWSSCQPQRTLQRFGLDCSQLEVGDVCISLTHKHVQPAVCMAQVTSSSGVSVPLVISEMTDSNVSSRKRRWSAPDQLHVDDKQDSPLT